MHTSARRFPVLLACLLLILSALPGRAQTANAEVTTRVRQTIEKLSSYPTRVPGSPGNKAAADYLAAQLEEIGLQNVRLEKYEVTAPVTKEDATLTLANGTVKLFPMYPNQVVPSTTPAQGIRGALVYAGMGRPRDFNGLPIEGSIVVLDFNSGINWITAADLGARAIIFLEPETITRGEAENKFAAMPIELPRYYAPREAAQKIWASLGLRQNAQRFAPPVMAGSYLSSGANYSFVDGHVKWLDKPLTDDERKAQTSSDATVKSLVRWERVPAYNVVGELPASGQAMGGKDGAGNTVVINSYFDSMAITPDLAPGAEAAGNAAALLEVARYFKNRPAPYKLQFVLDGAHHLALAGMRQFAARHFSDIDGSGGDAKKKEIAAYRAFIGIDLSSRTETLGVFAKSSFYNQMGTGDNILLTRFGGYTKQLGIFAKKEAQRRKVRDDEFFVDGVTAIEGRNWRSYLPSLVAFDSEVAMMAQVPAISFATANDARILQDTPFDQPAKVGIENLSKQIDTLTAMLGKSFTPRQNKGKTTTDIELFPAKTALSNNFGYVVGRGMYRDIAGSSSFLPETPMPDEQLIPTLTTERKDKLAAIEREPELTAVEKKKRLDEANAKYDTTLKEMQGATAVGYVLERVRDYKSYSGVRGAFVERATIATAALKKGERARTQFVFVGPRVGDTQGGGGITSEFQAYTVGRPGLITFAPDKGAESQRFSPMFTTTVPATSFKVKELNQFNPDVTLVAFPCRATTFADTVDQRYFSVLTEMTVFDAATDAAPVEYGFLAPQLAPGVSDLEPAAVVFSKPGSRFKLLMAQGLLGKRLVVLNTDPSSIDTTDTKAINNNASDQGGEDAEGELARSKGIFYEGAGVKTPGQDILEKQALASLKAVAPGEVSEDYNAATNANTGTAGIPAQSLQEDETRPNRVVHVAYQVARDLWTLDQQRIRLLKGFGITNQRVDDLHEAAGGKTKDMISAPVGGSIGTAQTALANFKYDAFYLNSRRAFGLESRAYPDVEATSQDVLKGIIFYLALLLPFAFFLERLIFGFPDVRKQITGMTIIFLAIFMGIRYVHPAFELTPTPFIILLAFIILALTVVVTLFLSSKFESEIKRMKQGVHFADVGRLSTLGAAFGLGIANMRRRPMRTTLTCVTLVLLTFTVLSFTSVTASISNFARPYGKEGEKPAYKGLMVRQPDWSALQQAAVNSLQSEFSQRFGDVARRSWYLSRNQTEALQLRVNNSQIPNRFFYSPALLGLSPEEKSIDSPVVKTLLPGASRWFEPGETEVAIVPLAVLLPPKQNADDPKKDSYTGPPLELTPQNAIGSRIQVAGKDLTIIGIYDSAKLEKLRDLDNEQFTPVNYQSDQNKAAQSATELSGSKGQEAAVQSYEHMNANAMLILPYETVLTLGGTTRSMAAGFRDDKVAKDELQGLMQRAALGIFGATVEDGQLVSRLYSSVESTSYEGFVALLVPILIAAAIIANTMLGSVFERTREIGIYSSVGLAPIHVAALFIAEAAVYAVLGSISGYLIAQFVAKIVTNYGLLQGITLNYSSSSAVISTLIVMATVLLSTLYPAIIASNMSSPDTDRKLKMNEPVGDVWRFQFPFTVSGQQPLGVAQFLTEFFETHTDTSVGRFYTDQVSYTALSLREAVAVLNDFPGGSSTHTNGHANGTTKISDATIARSMDEPGIVVDNAGVVAEDVPQGPTILELDSIAAPPDTEVYRLAMRVWLAPFDMGVSQDTDIMLIPSNEPGLYELQLKLVRQSGEIAAWKRVNRAFISDLRKQLLLWRTIKRDVQREYILRGRAHVAHHDLPTEPVGAAITEMAV